TIAALRPMPPHSLELALATSCLCSSRSFVDAWVKCSSLLMVLYDWVSRASVLVKFSIKLSVGEGEHCQQGVVEHMWKVELKTIVNSVVGVRHWTSKQEDP
nr:hypothetical protein [Tanacetum cinerariifolium]